MTESIFKIAFRNFRMHIKTALVLIVGIGVPAMLIVGGLSINDTIANWITSSFSKNFDPADAFVENRRNNIFMKMALDEQVVSSLKDFPAVEKILPVSETLGRIEFGEKALDCLIIALRPEDLQSFLGERIELSERRVIVSKTIADFLNLSRNSEIILNIGAGEERFVVGGIGEEGFLNFRGENLHYAGTVFVHLDDLSKFVNFPTRVYLNLHGEIKEHQLIVDELRRSLNVRAVAMKANLLNSPATKALGYLTIAFSGFSILASFVLVYLFAQSFVEERTTVMATLRILGMKTHHVAATLLIEGLAYLIVSGIFGGALGIFLARYLLNRFLATTSVFSAGFGPVFNDVKLHVSPLTVFLGVSAGLIVPVLIFARRILQITRRSPVQMLSAFQSEPRSFTFGKFRRIVGAGMCVFGIVLAITLKSFWLFGLLSIFVGTFLIFFHPAVSLVLGIVAIVLVSYSAPGEAVSGWEILQRGAVFFVGSWLIFIYAIVLMRKFLSKSLVKTSVSSFIALSYVERNLRNSFIIASMFSLIVFVMTIVVTVPHNVQNFVQDRLKNGLFGYDFMVVRNPLKLIFSRSEIEVAEGLTSHSRVYIAEFENDLIAFVDENFLKSALVPFETNEEWRERLLEPGKAIVGFSQKGEASNLVGKTVTRRVKSPFRIGGTRVMDFEIVDAFDMRKAMVPVKYVASINSMPKEVRVIPVLLAKIEPQKVAEVKKFYSKLFDFPIYINEELNRLFTGMNMLIQTAIALLYFGLISGFSGIAFHSLRSVIVRKRLIGTLRAVGMSSRSVSAAFILENIVIASLGIVVGCFAGYLESRDVSKLIFTLFGSGEFSFPLSNFLILLAAVYAVVVVVVSLPIVLTKKSPAEALRAPD
ncbi:FtsX-like permease family protein [Thermotoga caldifontis]|uniref:FtsX-like permease family protein n=1 Tax=Thermotoga caldifontis TaxID=1508419 RepID=UPI000596DEA1|nr:FtsX-like permease family protein [Thermotoga caldifontis]